MVQPEPIVIMAISIVGLEVAVKAQGWHRDPCRLHQDRYFSDGQPHLHHSRRPPTDRQPFCDTARADGQRASTCPAA